MILCEFVTDFGLTPFVSVVMPIPRTESWVTINKHRYWIDHTEIHVNTDKDNPLVKCECKVSDKDAPKSAAVNCGSMWIIQMSTASELFLHKTAVKNGPFNFVFMKIGNKSEDLWSFSHFNDAKGMIGHLQRTNLVVTPMKAIKVSLIKEFKP